MGGKMLVFLQYICRFNFGFFEKEECKKFLRMGLFFAIIVGVYWTMRPLKDAIFIHLVGRLMLPYAKTISLLGMLPLVMCYTKLLGRTSKERMFVIVPAFYGVAMFCFAGAMLYAQAPVEQIAARSWLPYLATQALGYLFYLFVESFGSLVTAALFWSFAADTTDPSSAKRGFPFVYALGQIGGIVCPYTIGGLPHRCGLSTDAVSLACLALLILLIIPAVRYFLRATPPHLLVSFRGNKSVDSEKESGFFEGLKLLLRHRYLLGIFAANFIYEVIVTIFDFNFKIAAGERYSGVALSHYLSMYGSSVNVVSLLCLLLGISNVTRYLGVGFALAAMPIIVGWALFGFLTCDNLGFLFIIMVGSKAINYALNGPALKQLYIPTTPDVRFKAQAWIETFGSRASKEAGSVFNMLLAPLQNIFGSAIGRTYYMMFSACLGFPLLGIWLVVALFLGRSFKKAVDGERSVC